MELPGGRERCYEATGAAILSMAPKGRKRRGCGRSLCAFTPPPPQALIGWVRCHLLSDGCHWLGGRAGGVAEQVNLGVGRLQPACVVGTMGWDCSERHREESEIVLRTPGDAACGTR